MHKIKSNKITILGGAGWLGTRCAEFLSTNYDVAITTTTEEKHELYNHQNKPNALIRFSDTQLTTHWNKEILTETDAVVISIPFSSRKSRAELHTRVQNVIHFLSDFTGQIILFSSTSVYPDHQSEIKEDTLPNSALNSNMLMVEQLIQRKLPQTTVLRLGGLMGDDRYMSKYPLKNIHETVNHIHYSDITQLVEKLIDAPKPGEIFNVVAPEHPSKLEIVTYEKKNERIEDAEKQTVKVISPAKIIAAFQYTFKHPNPIYFKESIE